MKKIVSSLLLVASIGSVANAADYYASVDGDKITKQDILLVLQDPRIDFEKLPKNAKKQVLDQIINKKLISKNALTNSNITNSTDYKNTLKHMKEDLAFEIWKKQQLDGIKVSDSQAKDFYNKNKSKFVKPAQLKARHILVKDESEAKKIISKLNSAANVKSEFIKLAKSKSTGPSGKNGGELGWFAQDQMVPEFSQAAGKLSKGKYTTKPVKTQFGYHIIFLEDKKPSEKLSYNKVEKNIKQILLAKTFNEKAETLANKLKNKANIVIK